MQCQQCGTKAAAVHTITDVGDGPVETWRCRDCDAEAAAAATGAGYAAWLALAPVVTPPEPVDRDVPVG